jgi:uncharacterized protein (DUF2132 family)
MDMVLLAQTLLMWCHARTVSTDESTLDEVAGQTTNRQHPRDPFHGVTLAKMLDELLAHHGWEELGKQIPIRCFTSNPSISSSLKFLRRTPWARYKVEGLYWHYLIAMEDKTLPHD